MSGPRALKAPGPFVWFGVSVLALAVLVGGFIVLRDKGPNDGDPGRLTETVFSLPADAAVPTLVDATAAWGLDGLSYDIDLSSDEMAGGIAVADFDKDGDLDLAMANGEVVIMLWDTERFHSTPALDITRAIGVTASDADGDGWPDLLVATSEDDVIMWGGSWVGSNSPPETTVLASQGPSNGLLAAELSGDDATDVVQLGRGRDEPLPDMLWIAETTDRRTFHAVELPHPERFSLAAEIVDVDLDGLLDVWITRDVGWDTGGDSVLSRRGSATGPWHDIAHELGVDLEVDAMGVTVTDLDGDARLDAYVSDLGDNEQLMREDGNRFAATYDTGAARIRPPGAPNEVISSSWASGATDLNLDGVLDIVVANGGFPTGNVRNKISDTLGPSLSIEAADDCSDTGAVVMVTSGAGVFQTLLAPHTYASSHDRRVVVGTETGSVAISVRWGDGSTSQHEFTATAERSSLSIRC